MDFMNQDIILFLDQHQKLLPLYEAFAGKMAERFQDTKTKVQKTQITFVEAKTEPYSGRWTTRLAFKVCK